LAGRSETVDEAKAHPDVFAGKTIRQIADHYVEVSSRLVAKPAVVGHSFGGLLTQMIAGRGLAAVSVALRLLLPAARVQGSWCRPSLRSED
jgi:non-heme chloroperoxidase